MNGGEKFYYVSGFQQGISMTTLTMTSEAKSVVLTNTLPRGFTTTDFVAELDTFYKDTENLNIPVPMAYSHVAKKLRGAATKAELEKDLIKLRQFANRQ